MSIVTLEDDFLDAAIELRYAQSEIKKLEAQEKRCKEILAKSLIAGDIGVDAAGTALVTVKEGALRFKAELAVANLPAEILASIMVTAPSGPRAKDVLPPAMYDELCCQRNAASVTVL